MILILIGCLLFACGCRRKVLIGVAAVMLVLVLVGFGEHKLLL
jgi:hypothetical protein